MTAPLVSAHPESGGTEFSRRIPRAVNAAATCGKDLQNVLKAHASSWTAAYERAILMCECYVSADSTCSHCSTPSVRRRMRHATVPRPRITTVCANQGISIEWKARGRGYSFCKHSFLHSFWVTAIATHLRQRRTLIPRPLVDITFM